jgi:hypothetical protein
MLVGYDIANPPGYTHNPLIRVGQTLTATYGGTSILDWNNKRSR